MSQLSIFRWRSGNGWLVLSGGGNFSETLDIDTAVLTRTFSHNPLAYIWAAGDVEQGDKFLDNVEDLGGRTGYLVDVITEDDDTLRTQLSESGIIVLGDGDNIQRLQNGLSGAAMDGIQQAYAAGATIYAQGNAASLMGAWVERQGQLKRGFGWVENAIIATAAHDLKELIQRQADSYGIGLGIGSALALSPDGAVEIWGQKRVSIMLSKPE